MEFVSCGNLNRYFLDLAALRDEVNAAHQTSKKRTGARSPASIDQQSWTEES
jgi:hypothetical protein